MQTMFRGASFRRLTSLIALKYLHQPSMFLLNILILSPGQTDRQVVASGRKLNLRRDLRWVAKRTGKFPRKSQENHFQADITCISLANNRFMDVTQLTLTWVRWPNGEKLALTCVQI